jgi:RNA polymerase sigma factor (TIGR02999 family)
MVDRAAGVSREQAPERLTSWAEGDARSVDRLSTTLYGELRDMARHHLRCSSDRSTLGITGLIHETYLRLVDRCRTRVRDRGHFLALFSRIMRQVVVDHIRHRNATKRGGRADAAPRVEFPAPSSRNAEDLIALDEVLERLKDADPRAAHLVDLRFFGGASIEEAAEILGVSITTIKRDWERSRAFLYKELKPQPRA